MNYQTGNVSCFIDSTYKFIVTIFSYSPSWAFVSLVIFFFLRSGVLKLIEVLGQKIANAENVSLTNKGISIQQSQTKIKTIDEFNTDEKNELLDEPENKTIKSHISILKNFIDKDKKLENLDTAKKLAFVIKEYAILAFNSWCALQYSIIFGSQILLLDAIKDSNLFLIKSEVERYFNEIKKLYLDFYGNIDLNTYLSFMLNNGILKSENGGYTLTQQGLDFLQWIDDTGKSKMSKPY